MSIETRLGSILRDEAECKRCNTCSRLKIRELFFEPNPATRAHWVERYGYYSKGLDRRLVFIAESPSDRRSSADPHDFEVAKVKGWRSWDLTSQDARFRAFRERFGFQNCLITNTVKCGVPYPSTPAYLDVSPYNQASLN